MSRMDSLKKSVSTYHHHSSKSHQSVGRRTNEDGRIFDHLTRSHSQHRHTRSYGFAPQAQVLDPFALAENGMMRRRPAATLDPPLRLLPQSTAEEVEEFIKQQKRRQEMKRTRQQ